VSINYGDTWISKTSTNQTWLSVSISATGQYQTAVVYNGFIYVSINYGSTWIRTASSQFWRSVSLSATGQYQTAVNNGNFIYTTKLNTIIDGQLNIGNTLLLENTQQTYPWVAVGNGTNSIAYSNDGINWTGNGVTTFSISGNGVANASVVGEIVVDASGNTNIYTTSDLNISPINGNVKIDGRVGIGKPVATTGTIYALDVNGAVNAASYATTSDYRIKENVRPITSTIDELQPRSYFNRLSGKEDMGFIAHEMQEHYPFLVNGEKDAEQYQSVNYLGLIGVLVKETQDLKKQIEGLQADITILEMNPGI
jgi:hypothetical protein